MYFGDWKKSTKGRFYMSQAATMSNVDTLVKEKLVPFRERLVDALANKHQHLYSMISAILANRQNKFGLQVTENGQVIGQYTFRVEGVRITGVDSGQLDSEIHHPFLGVVKPYASIERSAIERMIADEKSFENELFSTLASYLPDITIRFLR
jgi:hypothetical protein